MSKLAPATDSPTASSLQNAPCMQAQLTHRAATPIKDAPLTTQQEAEAVAASIRTATLQVHLSINSMHMIATSESLNF